jgi:hypothetical protein
MYVSGFEFHKLCDYSYCPRYEVKVVTQDIKENSFVFVNLDNFIDFYRHITNIKPNKKINLITHNSDKTFSFDYLTVIEPYVNKIYPLNCDFAHDKIHKIPLGFVDNKYKPHIKFEELMSNPPEKNLLVYMNFKIETNRKERNLCYNFFNNYNWITKEQDLLPEQFYKRLAESKYVISPEGTGIDCHRVYESIYCNAIPIVKTSGLDDLYKKLPVIIVQKWEDITEDYLNHNYDKFKENLDEWKKNNPDWFSANYWLKN